MKFLTLLALLWMIPAEPPAKSDGWQLCKDKQGIKVYSRSVEGSDIKEMKTELDVHARLSSVMKLLMDIPATDQWVFHCIIAKELKRPNTHEVYYYEVTSIPWPLSNRDVVIHSTWEQDEATKVIRITADGIQGYVPPQNGIVRLKKFAGRWKLTPKPDGMLEIQYMLSIDPAGAIPAWMVNMASSEGPYETNLGLIRMLELAKYKNCEKFVKE